MPTLPGLRDFFADLIHSSTPKRTTTQKRKRLTACGESLTSDEAMEEVRRAEEEKEKKEKEKKERAAERQKRKEEKAREKERRMTNKTNKQQKKQRKRKGQCPTCDAPYDEDNEVWIQCESCKIWSHKDCAGYGEWNEEELEEEAFLCSECQ